MNDKIVKVIIDGKAYTVTDKQAQQMLEVISGKVDSMQKEIDELNEMLTWKIIE